MGGCRRAVVLGVVLAAVLGRSASAQVPLPPPPTLPPVSVPAPLEPVIAVAGPTVGPVCGTASLLALLAPSLAEGYLKLPLSSIVASDDLRAYANTALYLCGFVPFPLTPTQCQADGAVLDALRGLNPLAAQVVGLFPEGAAVDTVIAIEGLLPAGPSVATQLADELSVLMTCARSAGPPRTPTSTAPGAMPAASPAPVPGGPVGLGVLRPGVGGPPPALGNGAVALAPATGARPGETLPRLFETRFVPRSGVQWLGLLLGLVLLAVSVLAWVLGRRAAHEDVPAATP